MASPTVAILMGSDSDLPVMAGCAKVLEQYGIGYEIRVLSAHRSPEEAARFSREAEGNGFRVIICGAGGAAHLAGAVAAHSTLPVIGVPARQLAAVRLRRAALDRADAARHPGRHRRRGPHGRRQRGPPGRRHPGARGPELRDAPAGAARAKMAEEVAREVEGPADKLRKLLGAASQEPTTARRRAAPWLGGLLSASRSTLAGVDLGPARALASGREGRRRLARMAGDGLAAAGLLHQPFAARCTCRWPPVWLQQRAAALGPAARARRRSRSSLGADPVRAGRRRRRGRARARAACAAAAARPLAARSSSRVTPGLREPVPLRDARAVAAPGHRGHRSLLALAHLRGRRRRGPSGSRSGLTASTKYTAAALLVPVLVAVGWPGAGARRDDRDPRVAPRRAVLLALGALARASRRRARWPAAAPDDARMLQPAYASAFVRRLRLAMLAAGAAARSSVGARAARRRLGRARRARRGRVAGARRRPGGVRRRRRPTPRSTPVAS